MHISKVLFINGMFKFHLDVKNRQQIRLLDKKLTHIINYLWMCKFARKNVSLNTYCLEFRNN